MTNIYVSYKTIAVAAVVAFGAIAFSSISAQANTTDRLLQCQSSSKDRVVSCCETVMHREKRPLWFTENYRSCKTAVTCKAAKAPQGQIALTFVAAQPKKKLCSIDIVFDDNQGSGPGLPMTPPRKTRGQ